MKRSAKRRPITDYVVMVILAAAIVWLTGMLYGLFQKEEIARKAASDARVELDALLAREATLAHTLAELDTKRGQEASLRETYGVARHGEEVIIVIEPPEEPPLAELSWWDKMLGFFGL